MIVVQAERALHALEPDFFGTAVHLQAADANGGGAGR